MENTLSIQEALSFTTAQKIIATDIEGYDRPRILSATELRYCNDLEVGTQVYTNALHLVLSFKFEDNSKLKHILCSAQSELDSQSKDELTAS